MWSVAKRSRAPSASRAAPTAWTIPRSRRRSKGSKRSSPKTGYDEALRAQIERETQRRSEQIENVRRLQSEQSALEHLTFLCPSAEDAAKNPDFAPIRARMLAKIHILRTREAELENLLAKLQERFGTLLKAQVRLAQGEAPSDVARDLYATQSVTETDRLYEAVLADQTPEGR